MAGRESQVYLNFLKTNWYFLFLLPVFTTSLYLFWAINSPPTYFSSVLLQMDYSDNNINQRALLTDQAVALIRSTKNRQVSINKLVIYKVGPLLIEERVEGQSSEINATELANIYQFSTTNFPLIKQGEIMEGINKQISPFLLVVTTGLAILFGLLVSLIKEYLKRY